MKTRNDFHLGLNPNLFSLFTLHCVWLHNIHTHATGTHQRSCEYGSEKKIDNFYRQHKFSVHQWSRMWIMDGSNKTEMCWAMRKIQFKEKGKRARCTVWAMSNEQWVMNQRVEKLISYGFFVVAVFYRHIYDGDRELFSAWFIMWCLILLGIKLNFARKIGNPSPFSIIWLNCLLHSKYPYRE